MKLIIPSILIVACSVLATSISASQSLIPLKNVATCTKVTQYFQFKNKTNRKIDIAPYGRNNVSTTLPQVLKMKRKPSLSRVFTSTYTRRGGGAITLLVSGTRQQFSCLITFHCKCTSTSCFRGIKRVGTCRYTGNGSSGSPYVVTIK